MGLEGSKDFSRLGFAPVTKHRSMPTLRPTPMQGPVNDGLFWNATGHMRLITLNRRPRVRAGGEIDEVPLFATEVP